jgi:O-antigen/teichoic acid export membrane protein
VKGAARELGGAVMVYGLGEALGRFINFLLLPLYTSYLTPTDYGVIAILGLITYFVRPLFSLGFETALGVIYFDTTDPKRRMTIVASALVTLAVACSVMAGLGTVSAGWISAVAFGSPHYARLVALSLISSAANILVQPLMQSLQFERRAKTYVVLTTVSTLVTIGLSVLMVVGLRRGVGGWVEADVMGRLVTLVIFLAPVLPSLGLRVSRQAVRTLLRLGMPLIPGFAFVFVLQQSNKYLLQWMHGLSSVGVYNIGFNLGVAALGLPVAAFQRAWTPYFMAFLGREAEARSLFGRILTYYSFILGGLSILVLLISRPVVMLLTQPPFHDAYQVLGLAALAQCLYGAFYILLPGAYFTKDVRWVTITQAGAALITVLVSWVTINWFGLLGAAIGLVAGALAQAGLQHLRNGRAGYLEVDYEWSRIAFVAALYAGCTVLVLWPRNFSLVTELALSTGGCIIVLAAFLLRLRPAERAWVLGVVRRVWSRCGWPSQRERGEA